MTRICGAISVLLVWLANTRCGMTSCCCLRVLLRSSTRTVTANGAYSWVVARIGGSGRYDWYIGAVTPATIAIPNQSLVPAEAGQMSLCGLNRPCWKLSPSRPQLHETSGSMVR